MSAPLEVETNAVRALNRQALPVACDTAIACVTLAFGLWTVATNVAVVAHHSFRTLSWVGPCVLIAGIGCGLAASFGRIPEQKLRPSAVLSRPSWIWFAFAAVLILLRALGIGYSAFWIASLLFLVWGSVKLRRAYDLPAEAAADFSSRQVLILLALALACAGITYVSHRPDIDDAVYAGTAADAVAHSELPVLSHDVLYGGRDLPPMLPSYRVESYELLVAFFSRWFGGEPLCWGHAIFPTLLVLILPFAWAKLMRVLSPRYWLGGTVLALVLFSLPGDPRALGNDVFVRLFLGKAILACLAIPLLYAFAWAFEDTGAVWDWVLLAATSTACVGLSASGIFVAPVALAAAALGGWRPGMTRRAVLTFLPAIYPLACGLAVSSGFKALEPVFAHMPARAHLAVTMVFGEHTHYLFLFALLAAPFLVRESSLRWRLMVVVLIYFLLPLNPFTFKLLAKFTTRDAVWRILWCVPVVGIAAAPVVHAIEIAFERWGRRGLAVSVFLLVCGLGYLVPHSSFAAANGVSYSLRPLKVPPHDYETARDAIAATPAGTAVLAPDTIAVWIPTFVHRPPLVSVRELYDEEMGVHMAPQEAKERRELRELVSGQEFPLDREQELLNALPRYQVGLIVALAPAAIRLQDVFGKHGYSKIREENGFVFFAVVSCLINSQHKMDCHLEHLTRFGGLKGNEHAAYMGCACECGSDYPEWRSWLREVNRSRNGAVRARS
jgi:hypothetical protein